MGASRLAYRLRRVEQAVGVRCPACAGRPAIPGVVFQYEGRLTDGWGNDIDPAHLAPCARCGGGGGGHTIGGVDPGAMLGIRIVVGIDPAAVL